MVSGIILPPRVIVGQKGRVTVSIEGRRVDRVQTAWFLNDTPISDTSLTGNSLTSRNPPDLGWVEFWGCSAESHIWTDAAIKTALETDYLCHCYTFEER